mmetsp:Transcript_25881/g.65250  ORF Transcript_25881/g.65250 Transcript_25881/m.65250 type:complete len:246 (-) Transcript_25881:517-1254(-)|eukprot:CAMPEP_0178994828 /NCGR_PEP_ID=MMETSP0795-20121207/7491_1 /TAXON_ID=88552 /ORGANISM="Amoebophrya sp., Strain Ameob2" /LENGTH=245 /DNA_ID=CAMNT_0020687073 /DNA_START=128 /DNA_END=865 /DNA_ORIENTATION=-
MDHDQGRRGRRQHQHQAGQPAAPPPQGPAQRVTRQNVRGLLPADVSLFPPAGAPVRTRGEIFQQVALEETKRLPTTVARKVNALSVNIWDMCARKKTNLNPRTHHTEPGVKRIILEFLGCGEEAAVGDPASFAAQLVADTQRARQKIADAAVKKIKEWAAGAVSQGMGEVTVTANNPYGAARDLASNVLNLKAVLSTVTPVEEQRTWRGLFRALPMLKTTLKSTGLRFDDSDNGTKANELKISWM